MLDLAYDEDSRADVDMNVVKTGDGRFIEVQGTAEGPPFERPALDALLELADAGIRQLVSMQREILGDIGTRSLMTLVVATTNPGKIREITAILQGAPVELRTLADFPPIAEPEETGATFAENARLKALYYSRALELPCVADDSGIEIAALGNLPGRPLRALGRDDYSVKFAQIRELLRAQGWRRAPHASSAASRSPSAARIVFESEGVIEGEIAPEPRGEHGFGYDPIFFYPPFGRTLGEVPRDEKATVSHRGQAFAALCTYLLHPPS